MLEPGVQQPSNCLVYTPNGPLPAIFVKEWANVPLPYPSCGNVVIAAAYQFKSPTQGGHSGSPVMTPQGLLFGMHFWGDAAKQIAFAIPAFVLFRPGLELARLRAELARVKMERDILKKATAYFARESL